MLTDAVCKQILARIVTADVSGKKRFIPVCICAKSDLDFRWSQKTTTLLRQTVPVSASLENFYGSWNLFFFLFFFGTFSSFKSRVNFLEVLQQPWQDYWIGAEALEYMQHFQLPGYLLERIRKGLKAGERWVVEGRQAWDEQLQYWEITSQQHRRIVTEAALYGSLLEHELYEDMKLISDDAKQFKVLGFLSGLCWVHAERHVARLLPISTKQRRAHEQVRDEIWIYYQQLKAYRTHPTPVSYTHLTLPTSDLV